MKWHDRLNEGMKRKKLSMAELSRLSGVPYDSLNKYVHGKVDNPRGGTIKKLAAALDLTPEKLRYDAGGDAIGSVPIAGELAAGIWTEPTELDVPSFDFFVPPDPHYPMAEQRAWVVRGRSIERVAKDGDVLISVSMDAGTHPVDGDLVVVERVRSDGALVERTAKRIRVYRTHVELIPEYEDQSLNVPLILAGHETEISIIGIALGVYRPLRRSGLELPRLIEDQR